jgi:predicted RNA-binding Zn-ribbon protein involved in translation (DUF1610 family)
MYRRTSLRTKLPRVEKVVYYQCPSCGYVSIRVTSLKWIECGHKRCTRKFPLRGNMVTKEDYERTW